MKYQSEQIKLAEGKIMIDNELTIELEEIKKEREEQIMINKKKLMKLEENIKIMKQQVTELEEIEAKEKVIELPRLKENTKAI